MKLRYIIAVVAAWFGMQPASAAYPQHLKAVTPDGNTVTVTAIADGIIKVTNTAPGETVRPSRASVLDGKDNGRLLNSDGKGMRADICGVNVTLTAQGQLTIDAGPGKRITDSGLRTLADGKRQLKIGVDGNGSFYGAGERGHRLNLRGDTLVQYNRQNYGYTGQDPRIRQMGITMPLFLSTDGYAIVFDDFAPSTMVLSNPITYTTESTTPVSWYFVNGANTLASVTERLSELTGRQELPPMWSLGYITSKYGYKTQAETEDIVDSLIAAGYPVDGVVLDLYWYGKEQDMGRLAWDRDQWPDPAEMMSYLGKKGVNVVTISQPYILRNGRGLDNYKELAGKGLLLNDSTGKAPQEVTIWVGEGGMFDVSNPGTRQWLTDRYANLATYGAGGWWGDLGEPEVHPETGLHANGLTARQYHNQYGNDWSQIIYDLYKDRFPDTRLLTMMRGGTTGLQRYDVFPWSTDVSRSWGGLEPQIRIMLNSGLSGLGYMGHDVGGFAVDPENPTDPELYVRWAQLGLFSPMLRTHAQEMAEPIRYPEYADILLPLVKERYRWLPYNYTLAWENATKGYPLVRPLNFKSTNPAENYDSISDEFLWGDNLLVAPVITQGATKRDVVLPAGSEWIDYSAPLKRYTGTVKDYDAPLAKLPMFVRAGSFIPFADYKMQNTNAYNPSKYTINYYPTEGISQYTLFEDDRTTPSAKSGNQGRLITMTGDAAKKTIDVTLTAEGSYNGADKQKTITFNLVGLDKKPKAIEVNNVNARMTWDDATGTATISFTWRVNNPVTIAVKR